MFELLTSSSTIINPQITQAVHDLLFNAIQLAILTIIPMIGYGLKLWISSMKTGWKKAFAERMVKVAEQTVTGNDAKFDFVSQKISDHFPRLKPDEINHLIEEAVSNLPPAAQVPEPVQKVEVVADPIAKAPVPTGNHPDVITQKPA